MSPAEKIDAQLNRIAQVLREARAPLIYGLTRLTIEAQELAVELAMCLRGAIDTPRGHQIPTRGTSLQLHGEARTTLGELWQYADLLVFFHCKPTPELGELFAVKGSPSWSAKQMLLLEISEGDKTSLDAQVRELGCRNMDEVQALRKKLNITNPSELEHEQLLAAWQAAKYPVLVYDLTKLCTRYGKSGAAYLIEQLERAVLARAMFGRAAAWPLEAASGELSNAAGAEYVLTARTGYPCAVRFFNGCAEFLPGVTNAEALLADGIIDAALFLGEGPPPDWSDAAKEHLKQIPTALLMKEDCSITWGIQHQFVQCVSLEVDSGTIVREDGVPLSLALLNDKTGTTASRRSNPETTEVLLRQLLALVRESASQGVAR